MGKIYVGVNSGPGPQRIKVTNTDSDIATYDLKHVPVHSPDGFQWGYGGSGPADAALSILTDLVGFAKAQKIYQQFKWEFIASAGKTLLIKESDIRIWLEQIEIEK